MKILFTICGRAGSKGFKNKNLKLLQGVPLLYYTLAAIKLFTEKHEEHGVTVAVNTDSKELIKQSKGQSLVRDIIVVERKEQLAGDTVAKVDVIQDTYLQCKKQGDFDIVVDLDITSPMRRVCDIENAIEEFCKNNEYDVVFSVVPARRSPYFNMVEKKDKYYRKICSSGYTARQQAPQSYELNASIYVYNPGFLESKLEKALLDYNCGISVMPDFLVLDIDSEEDFEMLQYIVEIMQKRDKELKRVLEELKTFHTIS